MKNDKQGRGEMMFCRRWPMKGIANFRDLGGYACGDGVTKYGVFFRSTSLEHATMQDISCIENIGITTVIDLRYPSETEEKPDKLGENLKYYNCSFMGDAPLESLKVVNSSVKDTKTLIRMYKMMLQNGKKEICRAFEILAEEEGAVLFHCAAGKDRTGVLAMLILSIAGVEKEDICTDYQCSSAYITRFTEDISGSCITNMQRLLCWVEDKWGSPAGYLESIGVPDKNIQKIKAKFVKHSDLYVNG